MADANKDYATDQIKGLDAGQQPSIEEQTAAQIEANVNTIRTNRDEKSAGQAGDLQAPQIAIVGAAQWTVLSSKYQKIVTEAGERNDLIEQTQGMHVQGLGTLIRTYSMHGEALCFVPGAEIVNTIEGEVTLRAS